MIKAQRLHKIFHQLRIVIPKTATDPASKSIDGAL